MSFAILLQYGDTGNIDCVEFTPITIPYFLPNAGYGYSRTVALPFCACACTLERGVAFPQGVTLHKLEHTTLRATLANKRCFTLTLLRFTQKCGECRKYVGINISLIIMFMTSSSVWQAEKLSYFWWFHKKTQFFGSGSQRFYKMKMYLSHFQFRKWDIFCQFYLRMVAPGGCVVAPGGRAWLLVGVCVVAPGGGHAWLLPRGWGGGGEVCVVRRYGDTINERAVRILLECILVDLRIDLTKNSSEELSVQIFEKQWGQECIPVGCVPSAAVAVSPAMHALLEGIYFNKYIIHIEAKNESPLLVLSDLAFLSLLFNFLLFNF